VSTVGASPFAAETLAYDTLPDGDLVSLIKLSPEHHKPYIVLVVGRGPQAQPIAKIGRLFTHFGPALAYMHALIGNVPTV